jgi:CheY-like chemotaxis protein
MILERCGYRVLTAASGQEAMLIVRNQPGVDLVLTDLEMPDMSGQELALWCQASRPGIQIVLMSGTPGRLHALGPWTVEGPFIHIDTLIKTIRNALDRATSPLLTERTAA